MRRRIDAIVGFGFDDPAADAIDGEDRADQRDDLSMIEGCIRT
jgi:hypothetical protein